MFLNKINYLFYSSEIRSSDQRQRLSVSSVLNSWQLTGVSQLAAGGDASVSFLFLVTRTDSDLAERHILSTMCFPWSLGVAFSTHFSQWPRSHDDVLSQTLGSPHKSLKSLQSLLGSRFQPGLHSAHLNTHRQTPKVRSNLRVSHTCNAAQAQTTLMKDFKPQKNLVRIFSLAAGAEVIYLLPLRS